MSDPLHLALLQTGEEPPAHLDPLEANFRNWFARAGINVSFEVFRIYLDHVPSLDQLASFDGFLITGSRHSVNDDFPWIRKLENLVSQLHEKRLKVVGVCFGHQLIAKALGGKVERNSLGWEGSWVSFPMNELPVDTLVSTPSGNLSLLYSHEDIVTEIPAAFYNLGGHEKSPVQGMISADGHILTFQGHPEFTHDLMDFLLERRRPTIPDHEYHAAKQQMHTPTDSIAVAQAVAKLFSDKRKD